jgi:chemotaxis protein methyltransferase CheR
LPPLPLSPQVFSILSGLVAERLGLHFDESQASVFAEKVGARAVEAGFDSLLDYYYYLRYDAGAEGETAKLAEALVVGETYLFRELGPLETAISDIVVRRLGEGRRPRVWCAASATGEEPHSFAILLAARGILHEVEILASDINASSLERAVSGRHGPRSLRADVPAFAEPWLHTAEREVVVDRRITKAIAWRRINLVDDAAVDALGMFDVILCRNVLIYFDDRTARRVVERLAAHLSVGGALFVGISESLLRLETPLHCEERNGVFLYRKVA